MRRRSRSSSVSCRSARIASASGPVEPGRGETGRDALLHVRLEVVPRRGELALLEVNDGPLDAGAADVDSECVPCLHGGNPTGAGGHSVEGADPVEGGLGGATGVVGGVVAVLVVEGEPVAGHWVSPITDSHGPARVW